MSAVALALRDPSADVRALPLVPAICLAGGAFGASVGSYVGGWQVLYAAVKMPAPGARRRAAAVRRRPRIAGLAAGPVHASADRLPRGERRIQALVRLRHEPGGGQVGLAEARRGPRPGRVQALKLRQVEEQDLRRFRRLHQERALAAHGRSVARRELRLVERDAPPRNLPSPVR